MSDAHKHLPGGNAENTAAIKRFNENRSLIADISQMGKVEAPGPGAAPSPASVSPNPSQSRADKISHGPGTVTVPGPGLDALKSF